MNELHRQKMEEYFEKASMALAEHGEITPIFFIIKDNVFNAIVPDNNMNVKQYKTSVMQMADEMDADAILAVCEQVMINIKKDDPRLQALLDGKIRPSEQPEKEEYLSVVYIKANGKSHSILGKIHKNLSSQVRYVKDSKWRSNPKTNLFGAWR